MTLRAYGRNGGFILHKYHVQKNADTLYVGFSGKKEKVNAEAYGPQEEIIDMLEVLLQQAMDAFTEPYGGTWGEHPEWHRADWGNEAQVNDTSLGYWAWVRNQIRITEADPMGPEAADQGLAREIAGTEVDGSLANWEKCSDCVHGIVEVEGDQAHCAAPILGEEVARIREELYRTGTCGYYAWKY